MHPNWKTVAAGALGGALLSIVVIFASAALGVLPVHNDNQIRSYLMANPGIVVAMEQKAQIEQEEDEEAASQAAVNKLGLKAFFDPRIAFIAGPAKAEKTVVEFFDYNCPYCRASAPAMKKFYEKHKHDTRFAFIEFPIKGPDSTYAARVALAARKQGDKYLALHFALMAEEAKVDPSLILADAEKAGLDMNRLANDMKSPDITQGVNASIALATAAKIGGTPFFIINGHIRSGALDDDILAQMAKS